MAIEKKIVNETHFVHLREIGANDKCPPQAKVILDAIKGCEGGTVERTALITLLSDGRLTTRQTPERILGFYKPRLIEAGWIEEKKVSKEIEVEVPDKPEKPAKAAAESTEKTEGAPASVKGKKGKAVQAAPPADATNSAEATA